MFLECQVHSVSKRPQHCDEDYTWYSVYNKNGLLLVEGEASLLVGVVNEIGQKAEVPIKEVRQGYTIVL